jgi:hypothetical protein
LEKKTSYEWPIDKFESRLFMIKQMVEDYQNDGTLPKITD